MDGQPGTDSSFISCVLLAVEPPRLTEQACRVVCIRGVFCYVTPSQTTPWGEKHSGAQNGVSIPTASAASQVWEVGVSLHLQKVAWQAVRVGAEGHGGEGLVSLLFQAGELSSLLPSPKLFCVLTSNTQPLGSTKVVLGDRPPFLFH